MDSYRTVSEVLKFVSPTDILRATSLAGRVWSEVSESRELWYELLPPHASTGDAHPKHIYREQFAESVFVALETKLLRFYLGSRTLRELPLSRRLEIDYHSSLLRTDSQTLFACGLLNRQENAVQIGIHSGQVAVVDALSPHRRDMGVILHAGTVLAFGGLSKVNVERASNQFNFRTGSWRPLAQMLEKRSSFNPCEHGGFIYLFGGTEESAPGELYNPANNAFKSVSVKWRDDAIAVFVGSCLYIIGGFHVKKGKLHSHELESSQVDLKKRLEFAWSNYTPLLRGTKLTLVQRDLGRIVELDLQSLLWSSTAFTGGKMRACKKVGRPQTSIPRPAPRPPGPRAE